MTDIVIPIKNLVGAKSRLSDILNPAQRSDLVMAMLEDVLGRVTELDEGRVWVVSSDDHALDMARLFGAIPLREIRSIGYNEAIITWLRALPDDGNIAVIPGDIPMAREAELVSLVSSELSCVPHIRIAPAHDFEGTNGLFLSSKRLIRPAFGPGSFARHFKLARAVNIEPEILHTPQMAQDVDTADDLLSLVEKNPEGATGEFLRGLKIAPDQTDSEDVA
ncbi:MAG: 2-phospho-L-lactate guanylyltransferase [Rhizobiaceae bacterium]|nr:2-phospho-L-lactate guanylyltransferase [Rhizobiaceae bacterium]